VSKHGLPAASGVAELARARVGDGADALLAALRKRPDAQSAKVGLDDGDGGFLHFYREGADFAMWLSTKMPDTPDAFVARTAALADFCRDRLADGVLLGAALERGGGTGACLPLLPVVRKATHVVVSSRAAIEQAYADDAAFFGAGWESCEWTGDRVLLTRAMAVPAIGAFLAAVQEGHWAMARAARPKTVLYGLSEPFPEEEPVFSSGASRLRSVEHVAPDEAVAYACALAADEHLRPHDVRTLLKIVDAKKLANGLPAKSVRVVFETLESAQREKRPLLDIGVEVFYQSADDALAPVRD